MNIDALSSRFKAFSEPVRLRILYLLLERDEICVCDLVEALHLTQSVVSRHLAYLKNNNLIEARRLGTWVHYKIKPQQLAMISQLLNNLLVYGRSSAELKQDFKQLDVATGECG
jgi:ArsR family transcriptional regulator